MPDLSDLTIPDWAIKGRKVVPEWRKKRAAKRARRFVMVEWGDLASAFRALDTDRATRLLMVVYLLKRLRRTNNTTGWIELVQHDLEAAGLADGNLSKAVARLEAARLVEVQRRPGKRPLLRLVASKIGEKG